jgi:DNA-binding NtrC family response regulator
VVSDDDVTARPAIVMVASNLAATSLVLPPSGDLGRSISPADERISTQHASVRWDDGSWVIRDLESRNGTFVNGERIYGEVKRRGEVFVRLGHTIFLLVKDGRGHPGTIENGLVIGPELAKIYERLRGLGGVALVQGSAGTGKQTAARVVHAASGRTGPFHHVACGSLQGVPERLLFGGKKGVVETIGHLQMARGGTLYLSALEELDPAAQATLVRVLDREDLEATIVCGARDLGAAVREGQVRDELYERLKPVSVTLPLLRARRIDLVRLIQQAELPVHARFIEACLGRPWPGNITELRTAVQHAVTRARDDKRDSIRPEDLADAAGLPLGAASAETAVERKSGGEIDLSPEALANALARAKGSLVGAARALNMHRTQLAKLLEEAAIPFDAHDD